MIANYRLILLVILVFGPLCPAPEASAGGPACKDCGCKSHVRTKLIAVMECREFKTPEYECKPVNAFYPAKGMVCKSGCRCDTYACVHRNCDSVCCTPYTDCRYREQYGASHCGTLSPCAVRQPVGVCVSSAPVIKWVRVPICDECGSKQKHGD
jgi:hypothetical protein